MDIEQLLDELIVREGGYSNHPADKGGPTNFGITEQVARAWGFKGDMRDFPRASARSIYKERYWTGPGFDKVAAVYPRIGAEMFDTGVNMGPSVAGKFLQRALNALNRSASDYPDIGVDGGVGKMTLYSLSQFKAKRGAAGEEVLLKALDCLQGARYIELAEGRQANEAFVYGWLANRIGNT